MNYLKPELLEQLAAEYVLGSMHGAARKRFEKLMMESYRVRSAVWSWEQHINPMAEVIPEQRPRKQVWNLIQARIQSPQRQEGVSWWWRGWAALGGALALVMAVYIVQLAPWDRQDQVAMFNDADAQPLWLITTSESSGKLIVKPINAQAIAVDNKAFELWMLPKGGKPASLGLMPVSGAAVETTLSPQLLTIMQNSDALAVSLEPAGGSPTGLPTGPVVYQAPIVQF